MIPSIIEHRMGVMRRSAGSTFLVCAMSVAISACAFTKTKAVETILVETPRGAVFLQHAEDGWFRTAHPFDLSSEVLAAMFRGVHVQGALTDAVLAGRVFSDEDTEFLGSVMSMALSKATARQVVGFRVVQERDGRQETTGGILYVQGRLLHLTLTHFRARSGGSEQNGTSDQRDPNPMGLAQQHIRFHPEAARRSSRHEQPDVTAVPPLASLVVDYEALITEAALPAPSVRAHPIRADKGSVFHQILDPALPIREAPASHERPISPPGTSQTGQLPSPQGESDLEALREEVRTLQRRLSELERGRQNTEKP